MSDKSPSSTRKDASCDRRCGCGKLAARLTPRGVEIKCSRCKRVMIVSWSEKPSDRDQPNEPDHTSAADD